MKDYKAEYEKWCTDPLFDEDTKAELKAITDEKEIQDRFYKDLAFGTGGLRGVIGAGTNRMNVYTVTKATQGLANFIIKEGAQDKGIAIAYDSRRMSTEFAKETALCMAANGIKAYLFDSLRPTPELSFALRTLGCTAGVVVTASHNPPEYNGYKVYWEDGAQITYPKDELIIGEVNAVTDFADVKTMSEEEAKEKGLLTIIGKDIDDQYIAALKALVLNPEAIKEMQDDMRIVYTPLHGTGNLPARRILKEIGFEHVSVVPEQELPDGNFPTVSYPNPEDPAVFELALAMAKEQNADLVLATDPDADRLGVYAKDSKTGEYHSFTGNMSGMLICEYELSQKKEKGLLKDNSAIVTTVVSSNMADAVAKAYGVKLIKTLTGFKFIGEQIKLFEENNNSQTYEFGFEESYGCLIGTHARDKDAIVAVMALCEAAAYYKKQGLTLWDQMQKIYEKYGFYKESLATQTLKGMDGAAQIQKMVDDMRNNKPSKVGDFDVISITDYETSIKTNMADGSEEPAGLPKSNVLYYELSDDAWFCVRPSGTEPKIKYYFGVKGKTEKEAEELNEALKDAVLSL